MAAGWLWLCFCLNFALGSCRVLTWVEMEKVLLSGEAAAFYVEYDSQKAASTRRDDGYKNFSCPSLDVGPPKDIHSLSPKYVGVMAAMGDSLTAANGAKANTLPGVALQFRGVSFSIGGDGELESSLTLPNVIRKYNPDVFGPSKHVATVKFEDFSELDTGIPGSRASDLVKEANILIDRLNQPSHQKYKDAWKVITLFIGANDICNCDKDPDPAALVKEWTSQVTDALDILAANLTHTFVNIVNVVNVGGLRPYEQYTYCSLTHSIYCPCNMQKDNRHNETDVVIRTYQDGMYQVAKNYEDRDDFTVVVQPFLENVLVPTIQKHGKTEPDLTLMAPDCFHLSTWGHAAAASYLWNNMLLTPDKKQHTTDPTKITLNCPDPQCPYFRTARNSASCSKSST